MITVPTVLIIGAGASVPYGLPLAAQLLVEASELTPKSELYQVLLGDHHRQGRTDQRINQLNQFIESVKLYRGPSLDAFLDDQPSHRNLGHEVIAGLMGPRNERDAHPDQDWLDYVLERMRTDARTPEKFLESARNITFVTFNFDSVIENRLLRDVPRIYRDGPPTDAAILEAVRVIHLHGQLPKFSRLTYTWVDQASQHVRVIHDELDKKKVNIARAAIRNATTVCFLGLSYHAENLKTLGIPAVLETHRTRPTLNVTNIFGSAVGLLPGERAQVASLFPNGITLSARAPEAGVMEDPDCRLTLRLHHILRGW